MSRSTAVAVLALALAAGVGDGRADGPDLDRLRREAALMPAAELEARLASPVRAVRLAAIAAAPAAPDGFDLLDELAAAAGGWDRSVAAPAARSARAIGRRLIGGSGGASASPDGPAAGEPTELDDDELAAAIDAWRGLAGRTDRWADVRVHALEVAVALTALRRQTATDVAPAYDLAALAIDPDPDVRRAAIELIAVPAPIDARALLVTRLVGDPSAAVRLAAAQALCADLPRDAAPVLVALGDDGQAALRALVAPAPPADLAAPAPGAAAIDAARCLAADDDPASRRALEVLRHHLPRALRSTLAAVTGDVTARSGTPR